MLSTATPPAVLTKALFFVALTCAGCANAARSPARADASRRPGQLVLAYDGWQSAKLISAPDDGAYALFRGIDEVPIETRNVPKGASIGFQVDGRDGPQELVAVAERSGFLPI